MIRPTTAFCAAAFAAVGVAFGTGYTLYPMQDDVAKLVVVEQPHAAVEIVERKDENLHVVREHPMKEGHLVSPFLPEHPSPLFCYRRPSAPAAVPPAAAP